MISARNLPLIVAVILLLGGGVWLLEKAERQARDTTRKHHLQDIEQSLYFARSINGTYPPYAQTSWCGFMNDPNNRDVRDQLEDALRQQNEQYANPAKPFPDDPRNGQDYFYWKRSPSTFELYAMLENEDTNERNSFNCSNASNQYFDYGLSSIERQQKGTIIEAPL